MSKRDTTKRYFKRLKEIAGDKALTAIETAFLQALATIEGNNLNYEKAYKEIKKSRRTL